MKRKEIHHQLYQAVKPLYRRLMMQRRMVTLFYGCLAALIQALIWLGASFLLPIEDLLIKTMAGGMAVFLAILLAREIWRPSLIASAAKLDALGFQERITTALEMGIRDDSFAHLQRQDTLLHLEKFPYRDRMPLSLGYRRPFLLLAMVLFILILSFVPNPQTAVLEKRVALQAELKEQAEKIRKAVDEKTTGSGELTEEREKEVRELLRELNKRLLRTRDYKEALKEISKTEEKLGEIFRKEGEERLDRVSQAMKNYVITQPLGEAVANRDMEEMKKELEKLREEARKENLDGEIMKALETAMKEIGETLPEGPLKEQMLGAAKAAAEAADGFDGGEDLAAQLAGIGEGLEALAQGRQMTSQEMKGLLQMAREGIADTAGEQDSRIGEGNPGGNSHGSTSEQQGNTAGDQGNTGSQEGSSGNGNDSQGENGGGNGGGAGTGSGQNYGGYKDGESNTTPPGKKTGDGEKNTEYEKVYVPERLGGDSKASQVKGNPGNQGDSSQVELGTGMGNMEGYIPYNQVFVEYSSQASQAMERDRIPPNMRSWVEAYFTSLDE